MSHEHVVFVNGERLAAADALVSIFDQTLLRGDGLFEVIRALPASETRKEAHLVHVDLHLNRLYKGAKGIRMDLPAREDVEKFLNLAANSGPRGQEGIVRLVATRGSNASDPVAAAAKVFTLWQPLPQWGESQRLCPLIAPWHPAGCLDAEQDVAWETVKWLSYGPNMLMTRISKEKGFDDAVLLTREKVVLDGPTFAVGWFKDGVLFTPCAKKLGMLPSCTLTAALEVAGSLGMEIKQDAFPLSDMLAADEVFCTSTTKAVLPVSAIGDKAFPIGPLTTKLAQAYTKQVLEQ